MCCSECLGVFQKHLGLDGKQEQGEQVLGGGGG